MNRPTGMMRRCWLALVAIVGIAACSGAARAQGDDSGMSPRALVDRAAERFDAALEVGDRDPALARARYQESAAALERVIDEHGVVNARLFANLGNTYLLAGDTGRAVLAFKRAERLTPTNARVQQALAAARARVGAALRPSAAERVRAVMLAWRGQIGRGWVVGIVVVCYAGLWVLAAARVVGLPTGGVRTVVPLATVAVLGLALLWFEHSLLTRAGEAVVVAPEGVVGRNGPSAEVYDASFTDPLPAGVEVRLLETRDGWARVALADDRETWIPLDGVEAVERVFAD